MDAPPLVVVFPLPRDNCIEIKLKKAVTEGEAHILRELFTLSEISFVEVAPGA